MVHFPPLPSPAYVFSGRYSGMSQSGFPHSEIPGSKTACVSPRLIAACHVLHRLLAPRHSPYALSSLTKCSLHLTACDVVKKLPIAEYSVVKKQTCVRLRALRFGGTAFAVCFVWLAQPKRFRAWHLQARLFTSRRLVENTGIEPVTSWLQTRRSPS
jgi:hypothetical protein